jgi:hypothetical protein
MRRIAAPALLVALLVPAAAGCGGGKSNSKAAYIELADAICRNHQSRREDLESQAREVGPLSSPAKAHRVATLLRKESGNLTAEARELEAREPPPADRSRVALVPRDIRARATAIERWAEAYDDLDERAIQRGQVGVGLIAATSARDAQAYGFTVCGR